MKKSNSKAKKKGRRKYTTKKSRQLRIGIWSIVGIISILALCLSWPYLFKRTTAETGAKVPKGTYCYGIDISHYQTDINWDSLRVMTDSRLRTTLSTLDAKDIKPISFVFIKASEGSSMKDKKFAKYWESAYKSGIKRGAYHFFRSSKDPMQQAKLYIKTVGQLSDHDLPPVLDIESIHKTCDKKTLNKNALIWLKEVEQHYGRKPIIYSSSYFLRDILTKEITDNYPIWVAHYDKETPLWEEWEIWQFSDKAVVYGIKGYVDLNVCTTEQLNSL